MNIKRKKAKSLITSIQSTAETSPETETAEVGLGRSMTEREIGAGQGNERERKGKMIEQGRDWGELTQMGEQNHQRSPGKESMMKGKTC